MAASMQPLTASRQQSAHAICTRKCRRCVRETVTAFIQDGVGRPSVSLLYKVSSRNGLPSCDS